MAIEKLFGQSIIWRGIFFITALLSNVLLSRYLQAEISGTVLYMASIFSFIALVFGIGLDSGLTFFASRKLIAYNKLVAFASVWVIAIAALCLSTSNFFLQNIVKSKNLGNLDHYAVFYVSGQMMMNFFSGLFYSKSNFWLPNLLYSIINILAIIAIPLLGYYTQQSGYIIAVYFYSTFLQGLVLLPAFLLNYRREDSTSFLPSWLNLKQLLSFSVLALGANVIYFLINRVDFYFVDTYCSAKDLGNYIQVARLGQMLLFFPQVLASVIFPQAAGNAQGNNVVASTLLIGRLLSRLYIAIFIIVALTGYWVLPFVFGHTFTSMFGLLLIFLPGFFALSHLAVIAAFFLGNGQLKVNITGTGIALAIVIIGDMLVVKRYGVFAAAAISVTAYIANFIFAVVKFRHKYNVSFTDLFMWQRQDIQLIKQMFTKQPVKANQP